MNVIIRQPVGVGALQVFQLIVRANRSIGISVNSQNLRVQKLAFLFEILIVELIQSVCKILDLLLRQPQCFRLSRNRSDLLIFCWRRCKAARLRRKKRISGF